MVATAKGARFLRRDLSKGGEPPAWLNDHPDDERRILHMQDIIDGMHASFPAERPMPRGAGWTGG